MPISTVRARTNSIKLLDVLLKQYDEATMPSIETLEANGLCVALGGVVMPVAAYEALCDTLGGAE
jgi:hypothetical protein